MTETIELHVHLHFHDGADADVLKRLHALERKERIMAGELDTLTQEVHDTETVEDSVLALVDGLAAQVKTLSDQVANAGNDAAALAQVKTDAAALAAELAAKRQKLADAITANTPPTPPADTTGAGGTGDATPTA